MSSLQHQAVVLLHQHPAHSCCEQDGGTTEAGFGAVKTSLLSSATSGFREHDFPHLNGAKHE